MTALKLRKLAFIYVSLPNLGTALYPLPDVSTRRCSVAVSY